MRRAKQLLCLGAAISILWSSVVHGETTVPPNPFGSPSTQTGGLEYGPGGNSALLPGGQGQTQVPAQNSGQPGNQGQTQSQASAVVQPPAVAAEGAVLLDCATGQILFEKNAGTQFYPASITKVMTALLTVENCSMEDRVTFSEAATTNLESGAVTLNLTAGDKLTVEQCLYALMLKSANEVANGLAEHISGSVPAFAERMNQRAAQLGCTGTHFANPNGLNNEAHVTTPYDMALIARAAFANPALSKICTTTAYTMPATKKGEAKTITMGHKMLYPTDSRYYPGMVGGKTGYTSKARNTLVTCVERNGVRLVAVVMKAEGTHYTDTKAMLDYGFGVMAAGQSSATGNPSASQSAEGPGGGNPGGVKTGWAQDQTGWQYGKIDGTKAANEWMTIDHKEYWFDSNTYMATGWRQFVGDIWYYFHSSGELAVNTWVKTGDAWFYVGADGAMLKNTTTPDGYPVGADGAWRP